MSSLDPYAILGVDINDDMDHIKEQYRRWMLFLHPDKGNFQGHEHDRIELFQSIKDAYNTITSGQKLRDYPEENIYYVFKDEQIQFRKDFTKGSSKKNKKVSKKFHKIFEKVQSELDEEDPNKRGYSEFNSTHSFSKKVGNVEYDPEDIFNSTENNFKGPLPKKYNSESNELTFYGTTDLGINEIHDLTIKTIGTKFCLEGTDISSAFTNQVTTDEQYMDAKEKYENSDKTLEQMMDERELDLTQVIEPLPENIEKVEARRKLDLARQQIQRQRDSRRAQMTKLHIKDGK